MTYVYVTATPTTRTYHDTETAAEQAERDIRAKHRGSPSPVQVVVYPIVIDDEQESAA